MSTTHEREDHEFFLTGGGPEIDKVVAGKANDFVVVEHDEVTDFGGNNTFFLRGSGHDIIVTGPGAGLIIVNKTSGATQINIYNTPGKDVIEKPKRIVYEGGRLTEPYPLTLFTTANKVRSKAGQEFLKKRFEMKPFKLKGSKTHHDVLSMKNFKPVQSPSSSSSGPMVVLIPDPAKDIFNSRFTVLADVYKVLFKDTLCFDNSAPDADPPVYCPKADERALLRYNQIKRFELSEHAANLVFLGYGWWDRDYNATREVISGPKDLYLINSDRFEIPYTVIAEMGTGANRVFSDRGNDAFSLVLDQSLDIIYDKGGENLVAVALPEGVTFYDVWMEVLDDEYVVLCGKDKATAKTGFRYIFHTDDDPDAKVQLMFRERTGKEVQFQMLLRPKLNPKRQDFPPWKMQIIFYFTFYKDNCGSESLISSITPGKGEKIDYACSKHKPKQNDRPKESQTKRKSDKN